MNTAWKSAAKFFGMITLAKTSKNLYNDIEGPDKENERKQKIRKTSRFIKLVPNLAILREFSVRAML